ncbi:unnamed protein product [Oreochromis niloticus]|nr:unnamed protein product [Mustela putorius furo]
MENAPPKPTVTLQPSWPQIYSGETVTVRCEIQGGEGAQWTYEWRRGQSSIRETSSEYRITVAESDGGGYSCRGRRSSSWTEWSDITTLRVTVPIKPTVTLQPSWTQIYSGETVTVRCEIQGGEGAQWTYEWRPDKLNTPPTSNEYRISRAAESDSGGYSCRGTKTYLLTEWSDTITLTVSSKPKAELRADRTADPVGGSVTLTCSVSPPSSSSSSGWKYDWYRYDSNYKLVTSPDAVFLSNEQISVSEGGRYRCRGERGEPVYYTEDSEIVWIDTIVSNRPVVTLFPNWSEIYRGETITVRCEIHGGDTEWDYEWETNSTIKPPNQNEYRIRSASSSNSGNYRCKGRMKSSQHETTEWSDSVTLTVSDNKPRPVLTVSPSWLSPGASVTLNCQVEHPSAGWSFYWYKAVPDLSEKSSSYELLPDGSGTAQDSYIIHGQTHTAGYVCRAGRGDPEYHTDHSQPKFVWSADVHSAASLTVSPDRVQHFTSDSVSLTCEGNFTEWRVRKFSEDGRLSDCRRMTGSTCNIDTSKSDTGVYWCESGSGEFSSAVNITVQTKRHRKEDQTPAREDKKDRRNNVVIPYVAGVSEKLRRVFSKHDIPVYFRPSNTLRQKLVHPKDKTPKHRLNNVVYAVQCSEECPDLYIGETKQPLHKRMAQHRRATSTGQDSAVHQHLKDKGHSFEDANVHILDREDRWFERGVKEAIYVHYDGNGPILVSPVHPVTEGASVTLSCSLRRQKILSNVFFYHNDKLIQNDPRGELKISAVSKSDEGFYKCQYSGRESAQSWMSVKGADSSSSPVWLMVGLVCGVSLIIILLLLLYRCRQSKYSCFTRSIQSESHSPGSSTNHGVNQDETHVYDSLHPGTADLYESVTQIDESANGADDPRDVTYSLIELKTLGKKRKHHKPEQSAVYSEVKTGAAVLSTVVSGNAEAGPKPTVTLQPSWTHIYSGETVTVRCEIQGGEGAQWTYEWRAAKLNTRQSSSVYTISRATESDGGGYSCRGRSSSSWTEWSDITTLRVLLPIKPTVTRQPSRTQIYSGETVTVRCEIQGGEGAQWTYEWRPAKLNTPPTSNECRITVSESDSGGYSCRGRRNYSFTYWSETIRLTVSSKPKAELRADNTAVPVGGSVTLTCSVNLSSSSGWKYYWYRDGKSYKPVTNGQISVSEGGLYSCRGGRGEPVYYTEDSESVRIGEFKCNFPQITTSDGH